MINSAQPLETLWEHLLSREPELIKSAYLLLTPEEQQAVIAHLTRMASEPDWHPEQQRSAQVALWVLHPNQV